MYVAIIIIVMLLLLIISQNFVTAKLILALLCIARHNHTYYCMDALT